MERLIALCLALVWSLDMQAADLAAGVAFPEGYKETFVKYHTINFPATRQVRYYYANRVAVEAAKAGKPMPARCYLPRCTPTGSTPIRSR